MTKLQISEDNRRVDTLSNRELWGAVKNFIKRGHPEVKFQTRHDRDTVGRAEDGEKIHLAPATSVNVIRIGSDDKPVVKKGRKEYTFAPSSLLIMNLDDLPLNRKPEGVAKEERFLKDASAGEIDIEGLDYIPSSVKYVGKSRKKADFVIQDKEGTSYNVSFKYLGAGQPSIMSNLPRPSRDEPWLQTMIKQEGLNSNHITELMKLGLMKKGFPYWHDDIGMDDKVHKALARAFTMYLDRHGAVDPVNAVMTAKDSDLKDTKFFRTFDEFWEEHGDKVHYVADTKDTFSIKLYTSDKEREKKDEEDKAKRQEKKMDEASHRLLSILAEAPIPVDRGYIQRMTEVLFDRYESVLENEMDIEMTLADFHNSTGKSNGTLAATLSFDVSIAGSTQGSFKAIVGVGAGKPLQPGDLFAKQNGVAAYTTSNVPSMSVNFNREMTIADMLGIFALERDRVKHSLSIILAHEYTHIRDFQIHYRQKKGEDTAAFYDRRRKNVWTIKGLEDWASDLLGYLFDTPEVKARETEYVHKIDAYLTRLFKVNGVTTHNHPWKWPQSKKNELVRKIVFKPDLIDLDFANIRSNPSFHKIENMTAWKRFKKRLLQTAYSAVMNFLEEHYKGLVNEMKELADAVVMHEVINDGWYDMGADKPDEFEKFRAEARERFWKK